MNPIAIAALIGGVGYAIYKFISRPTIDVETAPNTPGEKAMREFDDLLESGFEFIGAIGKGANKVFDEQTWGKRTLSHQATFLNNIYLSRGKVENFDVYIEKIPKFVGSPWSTAIRGTGKGKYSTGSMARAIKDEIQAYGTSVYRYGPLFDKKKLTILWANSEVNKVLNSIQTKGTYYQPSLMRTISSPFIKFHAQQPREDFLRLLGANVNQFFVFNRMPLQMPFAAATKGVTYYFYSIYPASRRAHIILMGVNSNRQITQIHQMRTGDLSFDAKLKLARIAYFGQFNVIYQLFLKKRELLGFTFEKRD